MITKSKTYKGFELPYHRAIKLDANVLCDHTIVSLQSSATDSFENPWDIFKVTLSGVEWTKETAEAEIVKPNTTTITPSTFNEETGETIYGEPKEIEHNPWSGGICG
jgi:hypothetical protein